MAETPAALYLQIVRSVPALAAQLIAHELPAAPPSRIRSLAELENVGRARRAELLQR